MSRNEATAKRLVAALKKSGIDYVFDTEFAADLTIMEEGSEFLDKLKNKGHHEWPMFTSCCPGWVRFAKSQYPEVVGHLSTAKSPQQMFGAVAKTYFSEILDVDPSRIFCVSIMPCMAKKHECDIPVMDDAGAGQDVDAVLTTREVDRFLRMKSIKPQMLKEEEFDTPLGVGTGAAVLFGVTGGVMEAALRSAHYLMTGENPNPDAFIEVRGMQGIRENEFEIDGIKLRTAVVNGLGNTRKLLDAIATGKAEYDFVEVMACPGGCSGGGGQPIHESKELANKRAKKLYSLDKESALRFSHENPSIARIYQKFLEKPMSHKAHELLHTDHKAWDMPS
jgi:NADH-quinone oxidoreductase subunit G